MKLITKMSLLSVFYLAPIFMSLAHGEPPTKKSYQMLEDGYAKFTNGDINAAEKIVRQILDKQPGYANANVLMAQISEKRKDWKGTDKYLSKALEDDSAKTGMLFMMRGHARKSMGKENLAIEDWKNALTYKDIPLEIRDNIELEIEGVEWEAEAAKRDKYKELTAKLSGSKQQVVSTDQKKPSKAVKKTSATNANTRNLTKASWGELLFQQGETLWEENDREEALKKYEKVETLVESDYMLSEIYWKRALYNSDNGNNLKALEWARKSANLMPQSRSRKLETAYLLVANGRDREATKYFEEAIRMDNKDDIDQDTVFDAAYTHKRLGDNEDLKKYLQLIIDGMEKRVNFGFVLTDEEKAKLYYARREHADLVRRFGSNTNLQYVKFGDESALQGIQEFYWQPYYQNGKSVQLYAQYVSTLDAREYESGTKTSYGALGIRGEPLAEYNLVLTFEQLFKLGDSSRDDTRVRVGYSWDNGLEKNPIKDNWNYTTFFNEFTHSLSYDEQNYFVEARQGRSFELVDNLVLSPHAFVSADYNSEVFGDSKEWRTYAGPGVHLRYWYREDTYNAPQSYFDTVVQFKAGLNGTDNVFMVNLYNSL